MGKNLHYSIQPFIENALNNHFAVESIELLENNEYYIYRINRRNGMSPVIVVLSDEYHFGEASLISKPKELKNGGFFLKARPEGSGIEGKKELEKLGFGNIGRLMGALNKEDFWNYEPPKKDKKKLPPIAGHKTLHG